VKGHHDRFKKEKTGQGGRKTRQIVMGVY